MKTVRGPGLAMVSLYPILILKETARNDSQFKNVELEGGPIHLAEAFDEEARCGGQLRRRR
jgi:hypothetical protein